MNQLPKEVIELIKEKSKDMAIEPSCSPSDWDYIAKYYRVGMVAALTDPEILSLVKGSDAVEFAEWIVNNGWGYRDNGIWDNFSDATDKITTELYQLFLNSKIK